MNRWVRSRPRSARRRRRRARSRQALTVSLMQPGVEPIRVAETGQVAPGADECLLDRVARELRVPKDQASGRVQPREGRVDESGEGVMIAPPRAFDELSLVHGRLWLCHDHGGRVRQGMASPSRERFTAGACRKITAPRRSAHACVAGPLLRGAGCELFVAYGGQARARSFRIRSAASLPGAPMTQPPGCVPEPHW